MEMPNTVLHGRFTCKLAGMWCGQRAPPPSIGIPQNLHELKFGIDTALLCFQVQVSTNFFSFPSQMILRGFEIFRLFKITKASKL